MRRTRRLLLLSLTGLFLITARLSADDTKQSNGPDGKAEKSESVQTLATRCGKSVVVVQFSGRDRQRGGLGSGFIIGGNGLIATNLHVIGEARPITVTLADGKKYDVKQVYATEKTMDLAILKIDAQGLPTLPLANSDALKQGQPIIALGNPLGLKHSLVQGVVSGMREIEGKPMIQLAVPIEEGNSGGPVLDRQGRVVGIMTMKHRFTNNLGFAVAINALKPLIEKPFPVAMTQWLTIGTLDKRDWKTHHGGRWRQRAGRIHVSDPGTGFGGRALCFSQQSPPKPPYEVQVEVRLHNRDGAAGLIFCTDGGDRHYGFYPTSGQMRLTRFDGPDVTTWAILQTLDTPHYRPGEWNTLKVRVGTEKLRCFLNDQLTMEIADDRYRTGGIGLAKFRHTEAEFRRFRVAKTLPATNPSPETTAQITDLVKELATGSEFPKSLLAKLAPQADASAIVLRDRARLLEQQAQQLRELVMAVHYRRVETQLAVAMKQPDEKIDLLHTALLIAWLDNDELDVDSYRRQFRRMAEDLVPDEDATDAARLQALKDHFFKALRFHGSRIDYYNRSNSYLNEVIDDREGLPISLSVLFMEMARRAKLNVVGIGLPGHFVVRFEPKKGKSQLIDVFDGGRILSAADAEQRILTAYETPPQGDERRRVLKEFLSPSTPREILIRMLSNLSGNARRRSDKNAVRRYANVILTADPSNLTQRGFRISLAVEAGRYDEALSDIDYMLEHQATEIDVPRLKAFREQVEQARSPNRR